MTKTLSELSDAMRGIDFAMLTTGTEGGTFAARPMSNNGEVDYDGDSYYFSWDSARTIADIGRSPEVSLGFQGADTFFVAVAGRAEVIRDKSAFEAHWNPDLDRWFPEGIDTEGLAMIKVRARRIRYWDREDEGEIVL